MKKLFSCVTYSMYQWQVCSYLKATAILMGLQEGNKKFCCFLCEWDSCAKGVHHSKKNWPLRKRTKNVAHQRLADSCTKLLRLLLIKFGLKNISLKETQRNGPAFSFLCEKFPSLNTEKNKAGVFTCPQTCQLCRETQLMSLSVATRGSLECLSACCDWLSRKRKSRQLREICVRCYNFIEEARKLGCNMPLKTHFLHSNLDSLPANCGAVSDELQQTSWRRWIDKRTNRELPCWPITDGRWSGMLRKFSKSDDREGASFYSGQFTGVSYFHTAV
jgi:hypothetical protein